MTAFPLDPEQVRDISNLLVDSHGKFRVLPAVAYQGITAQERLLFGVRHGIFGFPTTELVALLRERIEGHHAIEIVSGNGVLAQALGFLPRTTGSRKIRRFVPTMT